MQLLQKCQQKIVVIVKNANALWNRIAVAFRKQDANAPTVLVPVEISANADAIASVATNQAIKALKIFSQGFFSHNHNG
ncbi:MAG: hypothetical protein K2X08_06105 [Chlamydiales bacterium]|nr:hypothetical protein [Chlamydiales bacterium]